MVTLQINVDEELRAKARTVAGNMGLDLSSAVRLFLTQMVTENGLPFRPQVDPFYSPSNQAHLLQAVTDLQEGRNCAPHDLIED
jgi:DNA-damage-inducible protein J